MGRLGAAPLITVIIIFLTLVGADMGWLPAPGRYKAIALPAPGPYYSFILIDTWHGKAYPCDLTKCSRYHL
jgi:hypothetical protein